jgi:hypothetical protein
MPDPQISNFICPQCGARYKRVRIGTPHGVHASSGVLPVCDFGEEQDRPMLCLVCMTPLPLRDGTFLLKYLLVERPKKRAHQIGTK